MIFDLFWDAFLTIEAKWQKRENPSKTLAMPAKSRVGAFEKLRKSC